MYDREGHLIQICTDDNAHLLVTGQTRQGKTYAICRRLEELYEKGVSTLVVDYSGSYTEEELAKHHFKFSDKVVRVDVCNDGLLWDLRIKDSSQVAVITDLFMENLRISSYFQRDLLKKAVEKQLNDQKHITIPGLISQLKSDVIRKSADETKKGNRDNLDRLLTRLAPLESLDTFSINLKEVTEKKKSLLIIDVNRYPDYQREFLTKMILGMLWKEVFLHDYERRFDCLVLDEIQFLSIQKGSALESMLREGGKRNISVIMSTQYVSHYSVKEINVLEQAANYLIFHPNQHDEEQMLKYIVQNVYDKEALLFWEQQLKSLARGEAIYRGWFKVNGNNQRSTIILNV